MVNVMSTALLVLASNSSLLYKGSQLLQMLILVCTLL